MSKPNDPAYPHLVRPTHHPNVVESLTTGGVTKRELFAALAMQGFCARPGVASSSNGDGTISIYPPEIVQAAIATADALLAELSKQEGK